MSVYGTNAGIVYDPDVISPYTYAIEALTELAADRKSVV